jgi:hypothetical protein
VYNKAIEGKEKGTEMKATIDGKSIEIMNAWYEDKKRQQKMERELKKQRRFELTSDGIDPEIAKLMVDFDLDLF